MVRNEYPRPRLVRSDWMNLNGEWQFEIDTNDTGMERKLYEKNVLDGKIIVPFVPESKLSGVEHTDFMKAVWYKRTFTVPSEWNDCVLLHFGAVDYFTTVWVNGKRVGEHKGGYTPFVFDVTDVLRDGENEVVVYAFDDVKDGLQPSGKQSPRYGNYGCMYTRCTGIWQTVWLEHVPQLYITETKLTPDVENGTLLGHISLNAVGCRKTLKAEAFLDGEKVGESLVNVSGKYADFTLKLDKVSLWFPETPVLYDLKLTVGDDVATSYFGMRKVAIDGMAITINDRVIFQRLVLDQGYYPDGIYTAPSDEALKRDIEISMAAGFNGARMHMKVFEPRFSYWADRMGYLLWGEYPNWGLDDSNPGALQAMLGEWMEAVKRDYNSPAIIGWCPFNETSQNRRKDLYKPVIDVTKMYDPMRPVIDTSGYVHYEDLTDIYDTHDYTQDPEVLKSHYTCLVTGEGKMFQNFEKLERYAGQPVFVSEFGGTFWNIDNDGQPSWGYGKEPMDIEEVYYRIENLCGVLLDNPKICAFCYTQLTDVYQERNGIVSFDRTYKFDMERLHKALSRKAAIEE